LPNAISGLMRSNQRIEQWMAGLSPEDRVVTCTIVLGEILFGISRLPPRQSARRVGRRRAANPRPFRCEPIPQRAGDICANVKLARQELGLALDESDLWIAATAIALEAILISRDNDFAGIQGLNLVQLSNTQ